MVIACWLKGDSIRSIGKQMFPPLSYSTVRNIIMKFQETGSVKNRPRCGRPPKLKPEDIEVLKHSVLEDRETRSEPLSIITEKLNNTLEISVSQKTVRRALKKVGVKCHPAVVKPYISEKNAAKRVQWCLERMD